MISLSDHQLVEVMTIAEQVPRGLRGAFLSAVAELLRDRDFGDADVHRAAVTARATVVPSSEALFR